MVSAPPAKTRVRAAAMSAIALTLGSRRSPGRLVEAIMLPSLRRPVPQLEPLDFARSGFRQAIDDVDPARIFPRADLLLDVLLQRLMKAVGVRVRSQHHERLGLQQSFRIGFGHD